MKCKEFEIHYLVFEIFNEARNIFGIAKPLVKFSLAERAGLAADCCVVHTILLSLNWNEIIKIKHLINKGLDEEYTTKIKEATPKYLPQFYTLKVKTRSKFWVLQVTVGMNKIFKYFQPKA